MTGGQAPLWPAHGIPDCDPPGDRLIHHIRLGTMGLSMGSLAAPTATCSAIARGGNRMLLSIPTAFQEERHSQGRWAKRFSPRQRQGAYTTNVGVPKTPSSISWFKNTSRPSWPANLNIHLHCLVLDGVYRATTGVPVFHAVRAPTAEELQTLLARIIKRLMNRMHRDVQLTRPGTAPIARAVIRLTLKGLIPGRDPLLAGSTPRADSLLWPALAREAKTLPEPGASDG